MTQVKICGLTNEHDVKLAARFGVWACGFVLAESPRQLSVARAAELTPLTGDALAIAVVTTQSPDWIGEALSEGQFDAVQLSAGADGPSVKEVRHAAARFGRRPFVIAAIDTSDAGTAELVLLDARTHDAYGGTGTTLDWRALASTDLPRRRLVLAGGLRPSNVDGAIKLVRPFAVDVSGGIERAPGRKDPKLMRAFVGAVAGSNYGSNYSGGRG
jgi:phosphoribosylanthranilate isomerase